MRNREELAPLRILKHHRMHTPAHSPRRRDLVQFARRAGPVRRQRAMRRWVRGAALVGAVEYSRGRVEGQPAWHATACFLGVCVVERGAGEVEGVDVAVVVGCPEAGV